MRLKYILVLVLASQVVLFYIYYTLKDKTHTPRQGNIDKSFRSTGFWNMVGWDDGSEEESRTEAPYRQQCWSNASKEEADGSSTSRKTMETQPTTITTQTTITPQTARPENQAFQTIEGKHACIYSAYFDHVAAQLGRPTVIVISIIREDLFHNLYCKFSMDNISSFQVSGSVKDLPESHGKRHISAYIQCRLPANVRPTHVSISYQRNSTTTTRLQIVYPGTLVRNFTVCYSILHSSFDSVAQLIQSIEMNRILGAEHFVVYNYSISPVVDQILRRYQDDGLFTVLPWPVPMWDVHYFGQMAALNDCSFRNRNVSRFVVFVDTDEFIIPRGNVTWMELLDIISPQEHDVSAFIHPSNESRNGLISTGSFEFRSSFFPINKAFKWSELPPEFSFSDEEKNNIVKFKFLSLSRFWRTKKIYPAKDRTKHITRPELVFITGIHFVHSFMSKAKPIIVPDNLALVHHYRFWEYRDLVLDTSLLKFKNQLYSRILQQCHLFSNIFTYSTTMSSVF